MGRGRIWTAEEKAKIVVQGLKGRAVSEICNEHQIHQTQYYKWREQFLENVPKVFETNQQSKKEATLERENQKLKTMVGELAMELKKNDW
ncbi:MAG: transposase [Acidobacteria bacterium]|nr:transposase [Acidobacteriota bacterium]MCA1638492.1 transposase [Acidobacteriota bacterium]